MRKRLVKKLGTLSDFYKKKTKEKSENHSGFEKLRFRLLPETQTPPDHTAKYF